MVIEIYSLKLSLGFSLLLKNYFYIPIVSKNLISISVLVQDNYNFYFNKDLCMIYFENKYVSRVYLIDNLYHLYVDASVNVNEQIMSVVRSKRLRDKISQKYL